MSKLQPDDGGFEIEQYEETPEPEDQEVEQEETPEPDAESATDSGNSTHDKPVEFTEEQQRIFNEAVGKKVFKLREKEREAEALRKRLEELERQVPQQGRPVVPEAPDPFALSDAEYRQKLVARDQAIREATAWEAQQQALLWQRQQAELEQQRRQQERQQEEVKAYADRAKKLGVAAEELQEAGTLVAGYGIDPALVEMILSDDHGPLLTKYLARNQLELERIVQMPVTMAAVRLATDLKAKAVAMKPKVTKTPDPLNPPRNAGISPKPRGPSGATFE
jgi:multidrug efflux pump subunit AcrB